MTSFGDMELPYIDDEPPSGSWLNICNDPKFGDEGEPNNGSDSFCCESASFSSVQFSFVLKSDWVRVFFWWKKIPKKISKFVRCGLFANRKNASRNAAKYKRLLKKTGNCYTR